MSNTVPINLSQQTPINNRGPVYECLKCPVDPYQGEKSKVITHIYRKHIAIDSVPFYCNICKFVNTSKSELEKHVNPKSYPSHSATVKAMINNKEYVNEPESLLQNLNHYTTQENIDYKRLTREESTKISTDRKRLSTDNTRDDSATNNLLRNILLTCNINPQRALTENTEGILPNLLGQYQPTEFSLSPKPNTPTTPKTPTAPKKLSVQPPPPVQAPFKKRTSAPSEAASERSSSSSSSSSSSPICQTCPKVLEELKNLNSEVKTMATAIEEMIKEITELRNSSKPIIQHHASRSAASTNRHYSEKENRQRYPPSGRKQYRSRSREYRRY